MPEPNPGKKVVLFLCLGCGVEIGLLLLPYYRMDDTDVEPDYQKVHADGRDCLSSLVINHDDKPVRAECMLTSGKSILCDTSAGGGVAEFIRGGPLFSKKCATFPGPSGVNPGNQQCWTRAALLQEAGAVRNELGDPLTSGGVVVCALVGGKAATLKREYVVMVDGEAAQVVAPVGVGIFMVGPAVRVVHTIVCQQKADLNAAV